MGSSSRRKSSARDESFGFKTSSGVDYSQLSDRQIEDERFERQRALRSGAVQAAPAPVAAKPGVQSATMDAFMRLMTGKEERTIADRIADPNRPTWEQFKRENADKLDLSGNGEKEMLEYRKKLDAAREKAFAKRNGSSKRKKRSKKRSYSSSSESSSDSDSDSSRRRSSKRKSRHKKRSHKRRRSSSSSESEDASSSSERSSDESDTESRRSSRKHKKKSKKSHKKKHKRSSREHDKDRSPSPVRLSSFFQRGSDDDSD